MVLLKEEDKSDRGVHYEEEILIFALCSFHFSVATRHRGGLVFIRMVSWLMLPFLSAFSLSCPLLLCPLLLFSCTQPTDSTDNGTVEWERIEVSGLITQDTVWKSGKEHYVTGDITVEQGVTLTI